jgi:hypothetical protein
MGFFDFFKKKDPAAKGYLSGRAVAIPHYPRVETMSNNIENNHSADSVSTMGVTVRLLQPGESAEEIGSQYDRIPATGMERTTNVPDGCQRLHSNVPNWVRVLVKQEGHVHKLHTEIPVWVNPAKGRIDCIDKEKLIEELIPERDRSRLIFTTVGMTGKMD